MRASACLIAIAVVLGGGGSLADAVTITEFNIATPVFNEVYNDRIGNSRFFSGPNTDRVRISAFPSPSRDSDEIPVNVGGTLFQSTNGFLTTASFTHPTLGAPQPMTYVGLKSGRGGGRNEYTFSFDRANSSVAARLDAWDTTPFQITISNPKAPNGISARTFDAVDFAKNALPPFVTDVRLTGGGATPRLDWVVPTSGTTPTSVSIQVRRIDSETPPSETPTRITAATLVHLKSLPVTATSYEFGEVFSNAGLPGFPAGLEIGKRYEISVQLESSIGGSLKGRSRTLFEFAARAGGGGEVAVFLPSVGPDGRWKFDVAVRAGETIAIDPAVAIGYDYQIGTGDPLFASVRLPDVGDGLFDLLLFNGTEYVFRTDLAAGTEYFFAGAGVDRFRVLGIETDAMLNPSDVTAFVTELTFAADGRFTGTMTPLTVDLEPVPEPATLLLFGTTAAGLGLARWRARRRQQEGL